MITFVRATVSIKGIVHFDGICEMKQMQNKIFAIMNAKVNLKSDTFSSRIYSNEWSALTWNLVKSESIFIGKCLKHKNIHCLVANTIVYRSEQRQYLPNNNAIIIKRKHYTDSSMEEGRGAYIFPVSQSKMEINGTESQRMFEHLRTANAFKSWPENESKCKCLCK